MRVKGERRKRRLRHGTGRYGERQNRARTPSIALEDINLAGLFPGEESTSVYTRSQHGNINLGTEFETSMYSASNELGDDGESDDSFQKEVAQKTQVYLIGRQEAETEVAIDRLIAKVGNKDRALLTAVSDIPIESKLHVFVNVLLNRGANPSVANQELETPLHFAARRNFRGVCAKLLEHDALPNCRDKSGKMPYSIALDNANDEVAALLIAYMPNRVVRDLYTCDGAKVAELSFHALLRKGGMEKTVLSILDCMVDPYGHSGRVRVYYHILESDEEGRSPSDPSFNSVHRSPLQIIAKSGEKNIVFHDAVRFLIRRKWKDYARLRFEINAALFALTLFALTFSSIVAVMAPDPLQYDSALQYARAVFEVGAYLMALFTIVAEMNQFRKHKLEYWQDAFNWIDFVSSVLLLTVLPLRFTNRPEQWYVFSIGYLLWTLRIAKYAAVFRQIGAYTQILWRILSNDFIQFTIVFSVLLLAFSGSFLLSLRGEDNLDIHNETSTFWGILFVGVRILIEAQPVVEYTGTDGYRTMSCILMVGFLFMCCVVLLNILIAQLSDTYQNVQRDAQRGLEVNRAWIVAKVELNSMHFRKAFRMSHYVECEDLDDPREVLEKWETPPLNEMSKYVRDIWDSLDSHKMNIFTIKNRLIRQEAILLHLQEQMDKLLEFQSKSSGHHRSSVQDAGAGTSDRLGISPDDLIQIENQVIPS